MYVYEDLVKALKRSNYAYDLDKITEAYEYANEAHKGQMRKSGEPYIIHPIAVAIILADMGMDTETICAGLLHDVVEDTPATLADIKKRFGSDVALMVDGVTKLTKFSYPGQADQDQEQRQAENVRKMLLAVAQDVRVIIVKLADRLHNMRTGEYWKEYKRREKALETMDVYAPLADRLGIRHIKEELEDISIRFLDPVGCEEIDRMLKLKKSEREQFLENIQKTIEERLNQENMKFTLQSRVKSLYGIYRKVYDQGRNFDEIYDIYAVRVIVNTTQECYMVLGLMHDLFTPIPNRFKDYISTPKNNNYRSLHTTVLNKEAIPFEIQIRTYDMHYTAEYGIAAHWKYKAGIEKKDRMEERLAWVRQLLEEQQDSGDAQDILRSIKSDIAPEECFVFTPKGDVINLPTGSVVIDFAYAIHSEVGNHMTSAKVDGRIVPLDFKLQTGMIVEIITSKAGTPSRNWLKVVKTSVARSKIRSWFKRECREENVANGKEELERELRRNMINVPDEDYEEFLLSFVRRQHIETLDDLYAAIGYGGILLSRMMPKIKEEFQRRYRREEEKKIPVVSSSQEQTMQTSSSRSKKQSSGVIVEGLDSCLVKFAKCCNPLPGDPIVGFVTRGYGVSIHKQDCTNVLNSPPENAERWVKAEWANTLGTEKFKSIIDITSQPRDTLLADVTILLSNMHIPLHALVAKESKDSSVTMIQITVELNDVNKLNYLLNSLRAIKGVEDVRRSNQ